MGLCELTGLDGRGVEVQVFFSVPNGKTSSFFFFYLLLDFWYYSLSLFLASRSVLVAVGQAEQD